MVSFVKTNRDIARLLGIKLFRQRNRLRGQLSEINGWRARADFPKFQKRKGYAAAEVFQWSERFAQLVAPEKQKRAAVSQILSGEKPSRAAMKTLGNIEHPTSNAEHSSGDAGGSQKLEVRSQNAGNPGPVPSQAAMAVELQLRYQLPIKRQTIQNWIHGIHLPKGRSTPGQGGETAGTVPRFPAPDPGRAGWNNPLPCYQWYEKWIVEPTKNAYAGDELQGNLFERKRADATMAEFEEQIDKSRKAKAEADALEREVSAKWILREMATATATRAMNDLLHIVELEYERNAPQRRREKLVALIAEFRSQELGVAMGSNANFELLVSSFCSWDMGDERSRIDRIRAGCAGAAGPGPGPGPVGETSNAERRTSNAQ